MMRLVSKVFQIISPRKKSEVDSRSERKSADLPTVCSLRCKIEISAELIRMYSPTGFILVCLLSLSLIFRFITSSVYA